MTTEPLAPPAIAFGPRWPVSSKTVRDQVLDNAIEHADHAALKEGDEVTTYAELADQAGAIARWLLAHTDMADRREPIIAIVGGRSAHLITALLGIWRAGGVYLPVASDYPLSRIRYLLDDARPVMTLVDYATTDAQLREEIGALTPMMSIDEALADAPKDTAGTLDPYRALDSAAYHIYTSGSTGNPKGTVLTQGNVQNFVAAHVVDIGLTPADRQGWSGNVSFDASVSDIWPALAAGATVCLAPPHANENLRVLLTWLREDRVTCTLVPTAVVNMLFGLEDEWWHDLSMRHMLTGGDRLTRRPPLNLPFELINAYGPTEATVWTTLQRVPAHPLRGGSKAPSIGHPISNTFVTILDENLRQCVMGQQGELCIGGAGVARGYHRRPDVTREKFIPDYWGQPGLGSVLYRTGDQAVLLPGGLLQFVGRSDRQIALQGFRIEAGEVEAVLMSSPLVKEAIVKRHDYENLGPRLIAFLTLRDGADASEHPIDDIRSGMRESVPAYMVPNQFVILSEMPLTPNGKIDEKALTPPARSRDGLVSEEQLTTTYAAPVTSAHKRITEAFADVLAMDVVGIDDSFFDIGGDSLAGVAVLARLERAFNVSLPANALQVAATSRALAVLVQGDTADGVSVSTADSRDWTEEARHELAYAARRKLPEDASVFVTGAGGFIGTAVTIELLARDPHASVTALVHSPESAENLRTALGAHAHRARVLVGDLTQPGFGLSSTEHRALDEKTRAVIHVGAMVNHVKTYEALREANVVATSRSANFAWLSGGGAAPLTFASTISVDDDIATMTDENDARAAAVGAGFAASDGAGLPALSGNGYTRTKQISERRLRDAAEQGLPVRVFRVGRALPGLGGGPFNPHDTLRIFFTACLDVGAMPAWKFCEAAHPVDLLARDMVTVTLAADASTAYEMHYPPMGVWSSAQFAAAINRRLNAATPTHALRPVAWEEWTTLLRENGGRTAQQAMALLSVNESEDLLRDNFTEVQEYIAQLNVDTDPDWAGFDDAAYDRMAAELIRSHAPGASRATGSAG